MIRYRWHDLIDWWDRFKRDRRIVWAGLVAVVALWCIGIAWVGETELIEGDPAPAYVHKNAVTAPSVAAQVADPAVDPSRPAPAGSATDSERCEP